MRKRRQKLQVSTFPFLAVLLCAMGSLILLLLVIDRRAKIVASTKALQAAQRIDEEDARQAAARQAERERRSQELHNRLQHQDAQLLAEVESVEGETQVAAESIRAEQEHYRELLSKVEEESTRLAQRRKDIEARRATLVQESDRTAASQNELARLAVELDQLERTLSDLKAIRQRGQQTYSLVPYRGQQGDNRKPVYIECSAAGLIFHPDRLLLQPSHISPADIRTEVERRLAHRRARAGSAEAGTAKDPYLLMLIRPDGIPTYYKTLAALDGLKVDFGYEFVERDWVLKFPADEGEADKQQWPWGGQMQGTSEPSPNKPLSSALELPLAATPQELPQGVALGAEASPAKFSGSVTARIDSPVSSAGTRATAEQASAASAQVNDRAFDALMWARQKKIKPIPVNPPEPPKPLAHLGVESAAITVGPPTTVTSSQPGSAFASAAPGGVTLNRSDAGDTPPRNLQKENYDGSSSRSVAGVAKKSRPPGALEPVFIPDDNLGAAPPAGPKSAMSQLRGGVRTPAPWELPDSSGGLQHSQGTTATPAQAALAAGTNSASVPLDPGLKPLQGDSGGAGEPPLSAMMPPGSSGKPVQAPVARPAQLTGNRDWIIPIECTAEALIIHPGEIQIATASLASSSNTPNPLTEAVRQLIQRRQATVHPGEPPYRPQIRFLVRPDGLRSYYQAYPALEGLQVPMTRENLH